PRASAPWSRQKAHSDQPRAAGSGFRGLQPRVADGGLRCWGPREEAQLVTSLFDREAAVVMQTYGRSPVAFVAGEGSWLIDEAGGRYLDFLTGLAVTSLGHANPAVAAAVNHQMSRLVHVSNLFYTEPMVELAEAL